MRSNKGSKWVRLLAGTVMMLFMGLIYAWSIFRQPLNNIFPGWTPTDLSATFTVSMILFCIGGFVSGNLAKAVRHKWIVWISALLLLAGFVGISFFDAADAGKSLVMLYLLYGVLCGFGIGMAYNAILSCVTRWFAAKAGMASGILLMGFGCGGMALGSAVPVMVEKMGLAVTFRLLGAAIFVVLAVGACFLKLPDTENCAAYQTSSAPERRNYTMREMLKTPAFWLLCMWMILISSSGLLIINSAAVIAVAFGAPAVLGLIVSVFNGAGRVVVGVVFDAAGRKKAMTINTILMLAAGAILLLGAVTKGVAMIFVGLLLAGVSYGGAPAITSATILSFYGPKHYGVNLGTANFAIIAASVIGPIISSALQERAGGAYDSTFLMMIIISAIAMIVGFLINLSSKKIEEVRK